VVGLVRLATGEHPNQRAVFWTRQGASLTTAALVAAVIVTVWFGNAQQLGTMAGLIGAGVAFALQKVITAFAGYLVILRGKTFTVGDRITMGGVRGDVISLGFLQTRIMEMGERPETQTSDSPSWVPARQFTGRIVTVTNDKVFDTPIYNYTREFPFVWEEMKFPIGYQADRRRAEEILLECAGRVTEPLEQIGEKTRQLVEQKYFVDLNALKPRVFYHMTDNWLELHLRFVSKPHGARNVKDEISRLILARFEHAGIQIASATYDVVGLPPLRLEAVALDRIASVLERGFPAAGDAHGQERRSA